MDDKLNSAALIGLFPIFKYVWCTRCFFVFVYAILSLVECLSEKFHVQFDFGVFK